MNDLLLRALAKNPRDANLNYLMGEWYLKRDYTAAGLTFYLKAAEFATDDHVAYCALLKGFECYDRQGSRDDSAKILLQNAIALCPHRPEAYHRMSLFFEKRRDYVEGYLYANMGLEAYTPDSPLPYEIDYPEYGLLFQKAVCAYWWGKGQECRQIFQKLLDEHQLSDLHRQQVVDNVQRLGSGPASVVFRQYVQEDHDALRFKFEGSDEISANYAQVYQDMFVLYMHRGKRNGSYVEIGSGDPKWLNNTYLLESQFGWKGVGVEYNEQLVEKHKQIRNNPVVCQDAHTIDYPKLFAEHFGEKTDIDYLQLDCEPSESTFNLLLKMPLDKYRFGVITYEHDYYVDDQRLYRDKSRQYLLDKGYVLVLSNVSPTSWSSFEDWWVHPELVNSEEIKQIQNAGRAVKKIDDYFLGKNDFPDIITPVIRHKKAKKTAFIVDGFYEDPDMVRDFALRQDFVDGGLGRGFIGKRTARQFLFDGLKERFEEIIGEKITRWYEFGTNGRFQISYAGDPLVYHCDEQRWAGMLYLTPDAPFECGTTLYAHKKTRARTYHEQGWDSSWTNMPGDPHLDGTFFENVDVLGNVYNRLVIFDASAIHSASKYFGQIDDNSRLWQMFFFD